MKFHQLVPGLLTALLAVSGLPVHAADTLKLTPPDIMPASVGALELHLDSNLNGTSFEIWRIQPEGEFRYYSHTVGLCGDCVISCPLWEGDYRLVFTVPADAPGEAPEFTREFTLADPDMDAAQSFDSSIYTVTLATSPELPETAFSETEAQNTDRIITGGCSYTFARRDFSLGDVNADGTVNAADAADLLMAAASVGAGGTSGLTSLQCAECDLNGDGSFDSADAAELLLYSASVAAGNFTGDALTFMRNAENVTN